MPHTQQKQQAMNHAEHGGPIHPVAVLPNAAGPASSAVLPHTTQEIIQADLAQGRIPEGKLDLSTAADRLGCCAESCRRYIKARQLAGWTEKKGGRFFFYTTEKAIAEYKRKTCLVFASTVDPEELARRQQSKKAAAVALGAA